MNTTDVAIRPTRRAAAAHRHIRGAESPRRVLQVLLAFSEQHPHATISELAEIVGVPLSTCYRYVGLLREVGLVDEGERSTYHVTPQVMHVARAAQAANELSVIAGPTMRQINRQVDETVLLMQSFRSIVVCVESIASRRSIRLVFEPGYTVQLGMGASGKLFLAYLPKAERAAYLTRLGSADPEFDRRRPELEHQLADYARFGWATSEAEVEEGLWACAAAIRPGKRVAGAISVAGPAFRIGGPERDRIRDLLVNGAAEIAATLAG